MIMADKRHEGRKDKGVESYPLSNTNLIVQFPKQILVDILIGIEDETIVEDVKGKRSGRNGVVFHGTKRKESYRSELRYACVRARERGTGKRKELAERTGRSEPAIPVIEVEWVLVDVVVSWLVLLPFGRDIVLPVLVALLVGRNAIGVRKHDGYDSCLMCSVYHGSDARCTKLL